MSQSAGQDTKAGGKKAEAREAKPGRRKASAAESKEGRKSRTAKGTEAGKAPVSQADLEARKELAAGLIAGLKKEYPDAGCTLDYNEAWKLLVSVRLAAQCTDARVNVVVETLYEKFPDVKSLAEADEDEVEEIVRPCGLGRSKARDICACMKILWEDYGGNVPDDFDKLLKLPGVGRKSANLIMGDVFGKPAIVTDTHCIRLVNRMGLVDGIKEPKKVEMELWKLIPPEEGSDFCHRLVYHGREVCTARTNPHCERCCVNAICKKSGI
ncbi:endonuclease III [bacterium 1XD42-94]|nr:endonuclease III [bacterium 1XD42-76]NBK04072.1 endonuclease III [bacterium 1XD42-94]